MDGKTILRIERIIKDTCVFSTFCVSFDVNGINVTC